MEDLLYTFNPGTQASRAPLPTEFRHLLGFVIKDERFTIIHSQEELTNINQQLDQTLNLQVSNVIQRVIAQLIGLTDTGWRTIEATDAGALKVALDGMLSDTKALVTVEIDTALIASPFTISGTTAQKIHVVTLIFTVAGEVNITLKSGANELSGPMDFGGTNQPSGIVAPLGIGPLVCNSGEDFTLNLSADIQTSGFATYYKQLD